MRITLVSLWPEGGMLHYGCQLANGLVDQPGVRVTVVLPRSARTHLLVPGVDIAPVDVMTGCGVSDLLQAPLSLVRIRRLVKSIDHTRPDLILLNSSHPWLILALPKLARRYPVMATVHDVHPHPGEDTRRKRMERSVVIRQAQRLFVHRTRLKEELLAFASEVAADNVIVSPHAPYTFFAEWASHIDREPTTVLFFGRIRKYKGLKYLLEAFPCVKECIPEVRFIIAGEGDLGPYRSVLNDPNLEVHNEYIPDERVPAFFERATVLVLPYIEASESGLIGIAHSFRVPVVATRAGCLPEALQNGRTGILVPPADSKALAEALIRLLLDSSERQLLAERGYAQVQKEDGWEKTAERVAQAASQLL